jgi:hypothetical protein
VRKLLFIAPSLLSIVFYSSAFAATFDAFPGEALQLVLETQQEKIRSVDNPADWWHDTRERSWSVKRPVEPGVLDTTHTFTVSYRIDGVTVASWQVDTKAGTAVSQP